jgi:hypothetical protein
MRSLYQPDGSGKNIARLDVRNFDYAIEPLKNGQFPQYSGTGLFVLRCDLPASISLTDRQTKQVNSYSLRAGLFLASPFSGFALDVLPVVGSTIPPLFEFVVCKNGAQFDAPFAAGYIKGCFAQRIITDTAALQVFAFMVPQGAQMLRRFDFSLAATSIGEAFIGPSLGNSETASGTVIDERNGIAFSQSVRSSLFLSPILLAGSTRAAFSVVDLPIPAGCQQVLVSVAGAGLSRTSMAAIGHFE